MIDKNIKDINNNWRNRSKKIIPKRKNINYVMY